MRKLAYLASVALLCSGLAVAQSTTPSDQSGSSASQPSATSPQSSTSSTPADQNQATTPSTSADQGQAATTSDQNGATAKTGKKLPQTASPLPLYGIAGLGLMGAGLLARHKPAFRT